MLSLCPILTVLFIISSYLIPYDTLYPNRNKLNHRVFSQPTMCKKEIEDGQSLRVVAAAEAAVAWDHNRYR